MSGRKSSEVAAVLEQGQKVRQLADDMYARQIESDARSYQCSVRQMLDAWKRAGAIEAELAPEVEEIFGAQGKHLWEEFSRLSKACKGNEADTGIGERIRGRLKQLDAELQAADNEAASIRQAIARKRNGWYCDDEYRRAEKLVGQYQKLRDARIALGREIGQASQNARQQAHQATADENRLRGLKEHLDDMNRAARMQREADGMREKLRNTFDDIDEASAQKFLPDAYNQLQKSVEHTLHASTEEVLQAFPAVYGELSAFESKLAGQVEQWRQQKKDAEEMRETVMARLSSHSFISPVEYYNKGENGKRMAMFEYIKQFGDRDFAKDYHAAMENANRLIGQEDFTGSMDSLNRAMSLVKDAGDYASELQESMLKKTALAGTIQKVMHELHYKIRTQFAGDGPNDGYRITCSIGEEIIDFTHVDIDEEGKVIMDLDHHEPMGGTCRTSWQTIASHMLDAGIPITNVKMENGNSVLRAASEQSGMQRQGTQSR